MQRTMPAAASAILPVSEPVPEASTPSVEQLLHQATPPVREVLRALVQAQTQHQLFLPDQPIVIAVSGGADSLCLLHALHQLAAPWHLSLHVAHLDHALRLEAADDATFVANFAQQLALPFYRSRLTPGILDDAPEGLEAAARSARYSFLRQVASQISTQGGTDVTIATAHHQDDQAETLLLHLVQGSGLTGLAGMRWVGHLPDPHHPPIRLVRPLLAIRRADTHRYLRSYGLEWREDATNQDVTHLRNQVRHEVLPALAAINPNIAATLARTADLLAAEADHAVNRDRAAFTALMLSYTPTTRVTLDLFHLAQYDLATQRGVLRHALLALAVDARRVGMEGIDALLDHLRKPVASGPHPLIAGWAWTILSNHRGSEAATQLSLHRADTLPAQPIHPHLGMPLTTPCWLPTNGTSVHNGWQLQSGLLASSNLPDDWRSRAQPWRLLCDAEQSGELYLATFQAGMRMAPLGMGGQHRALGDIFTDHKIPPYLRPGWPVVINSEGTIIWLCGLVMADLARIQPTTRKLRQLLWQLETQATP